VLTIHDMTLWLYPEHHYRKRLLTMRPIIPVAARRAQAIIAVSQSVKADIVRILHMPADKVKVIYSAPADHFRRLPPDPAQDAELRSAYGIPEQFILYVGTIEPRKNLVRLLHAFDLLLRERSTPPCLVVVGARGWKDAQFFATIERLGLQQSVRYLGYVPSETLIRLYNRATALAFPSLYEGCGLPVLEAMACGTPVVTSCRGGLVEVAGDAAEFVEPTSVESIAHGLRCVVNSRDRQHELSTRGYRQAARFSWQTTSAQTRALYQMNQ
jgi:glycosyltransferase involved in cell wall biosynthesis